MRELINYYLLFWTIQEVIRARRHFTQAEVDGQVFNLEDEAYVKVNPYLGLPWTISVFNLGAVLSVLSFEFILCFVCQNC